MSDVVSNESLFSRHIADGFAKHILQKEKICEKDMTWIAAILDLI